MRDYRDSHDFTILSNFHGSHPSQFEKLISIRHRSPNKHECKKIDMLHVSLSESLVALQHKHPQHSCPEKCEIIFWLIHNSLLLTDMCSHPLGRILSPGTHRWEAGIPCHCCPGPPRRLAVMGDCWRVIP